MKKIVPEWELLEENYCAQRDKMSHDDGCVRFFVEGDFQTFICNKKLSYMDFLKQNNLS